MTNAPFALDRRGSSSRSPADWRRARRRRRCLFLLPQVGRPRPARTFRSGTLTQPGTPLNGAIASPNTGGQRPPRPLPQTESATATNTEMHSDDA